MSPSGRKMGTTAGKIRVTEMKLTSQVASASALADLFESQITRIDAFVHHHARIVAQFPIELARAHVHGVHARRAVLQQAVGEAAGGGADVQAQPARHIDAEMIQRRLQLQPAAAHIASALPATSMRLAASTRVARLDGFLSVDQHLAGHDESLRFLAGFGQAALDQQTIEPLLHDVALHDEIGEFAQPFARARRRWRSASCAPSALALPPCAAILPGRTPRGR